jgi:hypothetical protein
VRMDLGGGLVLIAKSLLCCGVHCFDAAGEIFRLVICFCRKHGGGGGGSCMDTAKEYRFGGCTGGAMDLSGGSGLVVQPLAFRGGSLHWCCGGKFSSGGCFCRKQERYTAR